MLSHNDVKKLFAVLQARYGHRWTTTYDDPDIMRIAVAEWHRELQGFRPEDIRHGLEVWRDKWPPTLPEFVDACMPDLKTLGFDVEREIANRAPKYTYVATSSREELKRQETLLMIRDGVERELKQIARQIIETHGIEKLIEDTERENKKSFERRYTEAQIEAADAKNSLFKTALASLKAKQ